MGANIELDPVWDDLNRCELSIAYLPILHQRFYGGRSFWICGCIIQKQANADLYVMGRSMVWSIRSCRCAEERDLYTNVRLLFLP